MGHHIRPTATLYNRELAWLTMLLGTNYYQVIGSAHRDGTHNHVVEEGGGFNIQDSQQRHDCWGRCRVCASVPGIVVAYMGRVVAKPNPITAGRSSSFTTR